MTREPQMAERSRPAADRDGIDALIEAAAMSVALQTAPDGPPPTAAVGPTDEIAAAALAAVEAALGEPVPLAVTQPSPSGHAGTTDTNENIEPVVETTHPEKAGAIQPDMVDGALARVEASLLFVDSNPEHVYERTATTQVLREAAATMRLLREKRNRSGLQMERWFDQWRAAEARALDLEGRLRRLQAQDEYLTDLLAIARSFCVSDRVFVEWRSPKAWVVRYETFLLTREGQWEPDQAEGHADPGYLTRTRYTLADAMIRARAVRLEGTAG